LGMSEDVAMLATTTFVLFEHTTPTIWALFMIYIRDSVVTWFLSEQFRPTPFGCDC